jgi:iron complex outermembrane receptor protein
LAQPAPSAPATQAASSGDPATALGTYNPALDVRGLELPPGTTITTAGPVDGYRALTAMSSTKTATPIEQILQSIQVVPKSLLEDQTSLTVTEAVQNVSNVQSVNTLNIANTDLAQSKIRGFKAEQWLDGIVVNYSTGDRDAFANVERVEVLKGPSAILYGGGSGAPVGGAINIVSKLPTNQAGGEFGVTFGSDSYARPYFDINQPLSPDGTLLFRITGEYTSADSFVDVPNQDRYSINPTLTLTNKTDTTLTIQGRASRYEQQAYPGLPAVGTVAGDFRIDRHLYIGPSDIPRSYTEVQGVTVALDHRLDDIWSFNIKGRWSQSEFDQKSQSTTTAAPDVGPTTWSLLNTDVFQKQEEFTINPNLQARFSAGPTTAVRPIRVTCFPISACFRSIFSTPCS